MSEDIDSIDISLTTVALHQSGNDGNFAGQSPAPDVKWNARFMESSPANQVDVPTLTSASPLADCVVFRTATWVILIIVIGRQSNRTS
jgi:hypothetical protein